MASGRKFKGYLCEKCRTYSRIYQKHAGGHYHGICPGCGKKIDLSSGDACATFFHTGVKKRQLINVWDTYRQGRIIGQVEAGTPAKLLEKAKYNGVIWYHVKAGILEGWVSGTFIRGL